MESGHSGHQMYIVTCDVPAKFRVLKHLGLEVPERNHSLFTDFRSELVEMLTEIMPGFEIRSIDMEDLSDKIWASALREQASLKDAVTISTCAEMAHPRCGHVIEINRIANVRGEIVGLGPRPGHPSLAEQFRHLGSVIGKKPVVLVEDGSFSGRTLTYLLRQLREHKINVTTVVIGFCFPNAAKAIREAFSGKLIVMQELSSPIDWMPDHDFIPLCPNCGRVVGSEINGEAWPIYSHEGISFSFPYVRPFGKPEEWASIPPASAVEFSLFCVRTSLKIYSEINRMNDQKLTLRDLSGTYPRISIPFSLRKSQVPDLN